jgi:hypothetical protein
MHVIVQKQKIEEIPTLNDIILEEHEPAKKIFKI